MPKVRTSAGWVDLSAFAQTIIDDADAATVRTTLGLGSAATTAASAYEVSGAAATAQAAAIASASSDATTKANAAQAAAIAAAATDATTKANAKEPLSTERFVPPHAFGASVGSPVNTVTLASSGQRIFAWMLDQSTDEAILGLVDIPDGWTTMDIDVWWASLATGDVVFAAQYAAVASGTTLLTETAAGNVTATAAAINTVYVTTVASGIAATAELLRLELVRVASNVSDTIANDIGVLGVMLRKVS